jgi:hypothetical protein
MKSNWLPRMFVKFACLLFVVGIVYAAVPPQTRPASIDSFLGNWDGTWSHKGASGGVVTELSKLAPDTARFQATISRTTNTESYEAPAKFSNGELNVDLPTLTMVFRLHGDNNLEVSYVHNGSPGTYSLTRTQSKLAGISAGPAATPAASSDAFLKALVVGSPWSGEFGPRPVGTLTVRFAHSGGLLTGEITAINAGTSTPGPLAEVQISSEKVSFKMPGNNVQVDLALKGQKLEGTWFGRSSGWMTLAPSKP